MPIILKFLVKFLVVCFIPIKTDVRQITFIILFKKKKNKTKKNTSTVIRFSEVR